MRYVYAVAIIAAVVGGAWWLYAEHKRRVARALAIASVNVPAGLLADSLGMGVGGTVQGLPTVGIDPIDPSLIEMQPNLRSSLV